MAFPRLQPRKLPTQIGKMIITLFDYPATDEQEARRRYHYELHLLDADNQMAGNLQGDLGQVIDASRLADLDSWMEQLRYKAFAEAIPEADTKG